MTNYLHFYKIMLDDNIFFLKYLILNSSCLTYRTALKAGAIFDAPCESECEMNSAKSFLMTFVRADCLKRLD